jgi:hypothetical protein
VRSQKDEVHLNQRRGTEAPLGPQLGHDLAEGQLLVRVRAEHHFAQAAEQLAEARLIREVRAEDEVVK